MSFIYRIPVSGWLRPGGGGNTYDDNTSIAIDMRGKWVKTARVRFSGINRISYTDNDTDLTSGTLSGSAVTGTTNKTRVAPATPSNRYSVWCQAAIEMTHVDTGGAAAVYINTSLVDSANNALLRLGGARNVSPGSTVNFQWTRLAGKKYNFQCVAVNRVREVITNTHLTTSPTITINGQATSHSGTLGDGALSSILSLRGLTDNAINTATITVSGSRLVDVWIEIEFMAYSDILTMDAEDVTFDTAKLSGTLISDGNSPTRCYIEYADDYGKFDIGVDTYPEWVTATLYQIGDIIKVGSDHYQCAAWHTSEAGTKPPGNMDYWNYYRTTKVDLGIIASAQIFSLTLASLTVDKNYHFRAVGANDVGTTNGEIKTFLTKIAAPLLVTQAEADLTINSVRLRGRVTNTGGLDPELFFEWGTTTAFGSSQSVGFGGAGNYFYNLAALDIEKLYYWRFYGDNTGVNGGGRRDGATRSFTTLYPSLLGPTIEEPLINERTTDNQPYFIFTLLENTDNPGTKYHARLRISESSDMSDATEYESVDDQTGWEYWTGAAWAALPVVGVDPDTKVRFQPPTSFANGIWYWDCASRDNYVHANSATGRYGLNSLYRRLNIVARIDNVYVMEIDGEAYNVFDLRVVETSNGEIGSIVFDVSNEGYEAANTINHGDDVHLGLIDSNGFRQDFVGRVRDKNPSGTFMTVTAIMGDGILAERIATNNYPDPAYAQAAVFESTGAGVKVFTYLRNSQVYDKDGAIVIADEPVYENDALRIVKPTTNKLTANQSSVDTDTTGFTEVGSTISRVIDEMWRGVSSLKVETDDAAAGEGFYTDSSVQVAFLTTNIASVYIKGSGTVKIGINERQLIDDSDIGTTWSAAITLTTSWQRVSISRAFGFGVIGVVARIYVVTDVQQDIDFWVDGLQIEESTYPTPWQIGETPRLESNLAIIRDASLPDDFSYSMTFEPQHASTVAIDRVLWEQGPYECYIKDNKVAFTSGEPWVGPGISGTVTAETDALTWAAGDKIHIEAGRDDVSGRLFVKVEIGGVWEIGGQTPSGMLATPQVSGVDLEVGGGTTDPCEGFVSDFTYYEEGSEILKWSFDNTLFAYPGMVLVTAASHGIVKGNHVEVAGTTDYNGYWTAFNIDVDDFIITATYVGDETGTINLIEDIGMTIKRMVDDFCSPLTTTEVNTDIGFYAPVMSSGKTILSVIEGLRRAYGLQYFVDESWDMNLYKVSEIGVATNIVSRGLTKGKTNNMMHPDTANLEKSRTVMGDPGTLEDDLVTYYVAPQSVKVTPNIGGFGVCRVLDMFTVNPNSNYTLSVYVHRNGSTFNVILSAGASYPTIGGPSLISYAVRARVSAGWTRIVLPIPIPEKQPGMLTETFNLQSIQVNASHTEPFHVDGFQLEGGGTATDFAVPDPEYLDTDLFISEPSISIGQIAATHITVKSPTHSYQSYLPGISNDDRIDRLIELVVGDERICREVSETLLDKWGKEQLSITGKLDMNLGFNFKEYLRVALNFAPVWKLTETISLAKLYDLSKTFRLTESAAYFFNYLFDNTQSVGPDEDLILQRKAHTLSDYTTEIKAGAIELDDNELIARIIEKLS